MHVTATNGTISVDVGSFACGEKRAALGIIQRNTEERVLTVSFISQCFTEFLIAIV